MPPPGVPTMPPGPMPIPLPTEPTLPGPLMPPGPIPPPPPPPPMPGPPGLGPAPPPMLFGPGLMPPLGPPDGSGLGPLEAAIEGVDVVPMRVVFITAIRRRSSCCCCSLGWGRIIRNLLAILHFEILINFFLKQSGH